MKKQQLMECPNCHKLYPLVPQHVHMQCFPSFVDHNGNTWTEYIAAGTRCQHCQHWVHIGHYNPELIERQKHLTNRRRQRAFKRDYDMFQIEVEKHLKESYEAVNQ